MDMSRSFPQISFAGSFAAIIAAACCILPMGLMVVGLGGAWIGVFGKIAAWSFPIIVVSAGLLATAWIIAVRRRAARRTYVLIAGGSMLTALTWLVMIKESTINDYLISLM